MASLPKDSVWFITGCSSGIGADICKYVASQGHRLVATARKVETLSYLQDSPSILKLSLDVTSESARTAALSAALERFGRIDVLCNNAGYGLVGDTESLTEEQMRKQLETNFWSPLSLTREAVRIFREVNPKSGSIGGIVVQVSSIGGRAAFPGNALYHASKWALEGFTESMAKEVHPDWNIKFLLLEPGGTKTEFAKGSLVIAAEHPAYADPSSPTRQLQAYMSNPESQKYWADPTLVVKALFEVLGRKDMPLRLVTGADGYALVKGVEDARIGELEHWKAVSESCSSAEQAEKVAFLGKWDQAENR